MLYSLFLAEPIKLRLFRHINYPSFPQDVEIRVSFSSNHEASDLENLWYSNHHELLNNHELPLNIISAYVGYFLEEELVRKTIDDIVNYAVNFQWLYMRKSWLAAKQLIFLDVSPNYLFYVMQHNYHNFLKGR